MVVWRSFREFNQSLPDIPDIETISELEKNLLVARSKLKEEKKKTKALRLEITVLKQQLQDANKQYEYLLGQYQVDVGNKIIHFWTETEKSLPEMVSSFHCTVHFLSAKMCQVCMLF